MLGNTKRRVGGQVRTRILSLFCQHSNCTSKFKAPEHVLTERLLLDTGRNKEERDGGGGGGWAAATCGTNLDRARSGLAWRNILSLTRTPGPPCLSPPPDPHLLSEPLTRRWAVAKQLVAPLSFCAEAGRFMMRRVRLLWSSSNVPSPRLGGRRPITRIMKTVHGCDSGAFAPLLRWMHFRSRKKLMLFLFALLHYNYI